MSIFSDLTERLRALLLPGRASRELEEEMRFHMERDAEERRRRGETPEGAARNSALAFGGVDRFQEEVRDASGVRPLQDVWSDVRYALRALRRNPGFTIAAVLVLGIGIGATTASFAVVDTVLVSQLPFPHAERLVRIFPRQTRSFANLSTVDFQAIREQQRSFDAVGALQLRAFAMAGEGEPRLIGGGRVTTGFFQALSVTAAHGRLIEERDEVVGAPPVAVLAPALADELFGGARAAVGQTITLDGASHMIIGVLPTGPTAVAGLAGFRGRIWTAAQMPTPERRGPFWIRGIARLRDGVTIADATRDLAGISERIFPIWAAGFQDADARFTPVPLRQAIVGNAGTRVGLFTAAVTLVLLVAIANVATLVLVRASARAQELAVRVSLGAPRARLARLVLVEGLTLTAFAGLVGVLVAVAGVKLAGAAAPGLPRLAEVSLDGRALAFAAGATLLAGVLVSLSPLSSVLARNASHTLRAGARRIGTSRGTNIVRTTLVTTEFALALPLLMGAGLLFNSFLKLQDVDPGFEPEGLVTTSVALPASRYADSAAAPFWRRAETLIQDHPAIASLGVSTELPPSNPGNENNFDLVDHPVPAEADQPTSVFAFVTNGYFTTMGVSLLDGRVFLPGDTASAPPVAVVTEAWARRFFPGEHAVGRQFVSGGCLTCPRTTIVGIVGDVKYRGLREPGEAVYQPFAQGSNRSASVVARGRGSAGETLNALRDVMRRLDGELPISQATFDELLDGELANPRRWAAIIGAFSAAALLLAALGIFGLMSYMVRQRQREIGVRIALGAQPRSVTWMIVGRGMRVSLLGLAVGLVLALIEARWLEAVLYGVGGTDPVTLVTVAAGLLGSAFLACWLPGRRAARISPVEAIAVD